MATRNPMNERYRGEGPVGKTKKSAASAKPKSQAAASVYIEKKPETPREKRAAKKRREDEKRRKDQEKLKRTQEKEKAARIAAGIEPEPEEQKKSGLQGFRDMLFPSRGNAKVESVDKEVSEMTEDDMDSTESVNQTTKTTKTAKTTKATNAANAAEKTGEDSKEITSSTNKTSPTVGAGSASSSNLATPQTAQYKKLRKIYWGLMGVALVMVGSTLVIQFMGVELTTYWYILLGAGYVSAIGALVLDFTKIKPLQKKHQQTASSVKKSPKQIKHETEAAAYALELEQARAAEKAAKKGSRRGSAFRKQSGKK